MPHLATPIDRSTLRRRIGLLALGCLAWGGCVGLRLVDLQVWRSGKMRALARAQQEQVISLDARRGLLYDRSGRELAMSVEVDSVYAVPAEIDDPARTAAALATTLGIERSAIPSLREKLTGDKMFVWVKRKVEPSARAAVEALGLKGVGFVSEHKRFYPHGELGAHLLGWVGMDNVGMDGLELELDKAIRGQNGQVFALRDARGKKFLKAVRREPVPGHAVTLTLDQTIQHITERELARAVDETGALAGSAIVLDPDTGDILALANEPTFNPNRPSDAPAEHRKNRAVVDAYEPGSTFKIVTMAAALERGLVRPSEIIDCQHGSIRVGRALIRDHKPFGLLSASEVLQESSNVGAIKVGLRVREHDLHETMLTFGFGSRTGIELPGEAAGLVRPPDQWSGVSQASLSFGQELSVTPLQLATAIAAVANGGTIRRPRILMKETDALGGLVSETSPDAGRRILQSGTVATLRKMMIAVVEDGTAKAARLPGYTVAGKTGTAQKIGSDGTYANRNFVASFIGFVPAARPALVILVVLDEPRGALYHGGDVAAPAFQRIALPALRYLGVPTEEGKLPRSGEEATLAAVAHARRWVEPIPLGEEERRAERERHRLQEQKRQAQLRRQEARRKRAEARELRESRESRESEDQPLPARVPLPAARSVVADGQVLLANLRGHSLRRVVGYLGRVGLRVRVLFATEATPSPGEEVIVAQEPSPGLTVAQGEEVSVWLGVLTQASDEDRRAGGGNVRAGEYRRTPDSGN